MNKYVEEAVDGVILKTKSDVPRMIAIQAMHYTMGVIAGVTRIKVKSLDGSVHPINYYGVSFANSGRGKDYSVTKAKSINVFMC